MVFRVLSCFWFDYKFDIFTSPAASAAPPELPLTAGVMVVVAVNMASAAWAGDSSAPVEAAVDLTAAGAVVVSSFRTTAAVVWSCFPPPPGPPGGAGVLSVGCWSEVGMVWSLNEI